MRFKSIIGEILFEMEDKKKFYEVSIELRDIRDYEMENYKKILNVLPSFKYVCDKIRSWKQNPIECIPKEEKLKSFNTILSDKKELLEKLNLVYPKRHKIGTLAKNRIRKHIEGLLYYIDLIESDII